MHHFSHVPYPTEPPIDCAKDAFRIIREDRFGEEKALFTKHVYTIQGFVFGLYPGEPDHPTPIGSHPNTAAEMEEMIDAATTEQVAIGAQALPWGLILSILKAALDEWLNSRD